MINTIINGDCIEVMAQIPDKSVDMILCDLPYGTTGLEWDVIIPFDQLWAQYERIITDNGAIVLTASQPFTTKCVMSNPKLFKYEWIWVKNNSTGFANSKTRPLKKHENILVFYKKRPVYNPQGLVQIESKPKSTVRKDMLGFINTPGEDYRHGRELKNKRSGSIGTHLSTKFKNPEGTYIQTHTNYPTSILNFKIPSNKTRIHPTEKPVELWEYLIRTYTNEGMTVLDNCSGSGVTAVACINTNRNYICIEKDEIYYQKSTERIKNHTKTN